jgi:hypothetical protein
MTTSLGSVVSSIATVTLIAAATRWLATAKGSDFPENLSITTGSVTTDQAGITKKGLWRNYSLQWKEIIEIRLHKKQGGAIELRAGPEASHGLPF